MPEPVRPGDVPDLTDFLRGADLTVAGLDAPAVRVWARLFRQTGQLEREVAWSLALTE
ncbi:hypothetical protein [Isoptericola sp. NPDC019482]|uniref:hypothetical protein n=1 Tax=Isoptericola sp. NPDC019482 TaxID=3154688 RepID=UPI00346CD125